MTRDEQLIEAAQILDKWLDERGMHSNSPRLPLVKRMAAVFEESLAPTGDDREAQARAWDTGRRDGLYDGRAANPVKFEDRPNPFRSEVPEPSAEPRHFAPYGSTNAQCEKTVPRDVAWDAYSGEYADRRFTTRRERTTCGECRWRMGLGATAVQGEPSDARQAAARAIFEGYVGRAEGFDKPAFAYDREKAEHVAERALRAAAAVRGTGGEQ